MTNTYARERQLPTGTMQARDLVAGDVIQLRRPGRVDQTAETVLATRWNGVQVVLTLSYGTHETSPTMPVRLAVTL